MLAAVRRVAAGKGFVIEDYPSPELRDTDAIVRIEAAGLCGTDVQIWNGTYIGRTGPIEPPLIAGHEFVGPIDAAEWVGPLEDEKLGFNKVAQYYYSPGWWDANAMVMTLINEAKWKELPRQYQIAHTSACAEANTWAQAQTDAGSPAAQRRLVAGGTKLRRFSKEVMEACESAAYEVFADLMSKSEHWRRIYPGWKKFRDEQFRWFRVAENAYDNYAFYSKLGDGK